MACNTMVTTVIIILHQFYGTSNKNYSISNRSVTYYLLRGNTFDSFGKSMTIGRFYSKNCDNILLTKMRTFIVLQNIMILSQPTSIISIIQRNHMYHKGNIGIKEYDNFFLVFLMENEQISCIELTCSVQGSSRRSGRNDGEESRTHVGLVGHHYGTLDPSPLAALGLVDRVSIPQRIKSVIIHMKPPHDDLLQRPIRLRPRPGALRPSIYRRLLLHHR